MQVKGKKITPSIEVNFDMQDQIICPITDKLSECVWLVFCTANTGKPPQIPVTYAVVEDFLLSLDEEYRIHYESQMCLLTIDKNKNTCYVQAQDEEAQGALDISKIELKKLFSAISKHLEKYHKK